MPAPKEILSPSRRHDLRHRCGEVVGVAPVIAAGIAKRPDTHPDIDGRANTMTVMASERGDNEMLLLRLQAREPRLDRYVRDGDVTHPNRAIQHRQLARDAELPTA